MREVSKGGSKHAILKFLVFVREDEPQLIKTYNECRRRLDIRKEELQLRDQAIVAYKQQRGIPIKVDSDVNELYSFQNEDVSYARLQQLTEEAKEKALI